MNLSLLATYPTLTEANLVKAKLEAYGIESVVEADVGSSTLPVFERVEGVKVLVRAEDLPEAYEVLERMLPATTSDSEGVTPDLSPDSAIGRGE